MRFDGRLLAVAQGRKAPPKLSTPSTEGVSFQRLLRPTLLHSHTLGLTHGSAAAASAASRGRVQSEVRHHRLCPQVPQRNIGYEYLGLWLRYSSSCKQLAERFQNDERELARADNDAT